MVLSLSICIYDTKISSWSRDSSHTPAHALDLVARVRAGLHPRAASRRTISPTGAHSMTLEELILYTMHTYNIYEPITARLARRHGHYGAEWGPAEAARPARPRASRAAVRAFERP